MQVQADRDGQAAAFADAYDASELHDRVQQELKLAGAGAEPSAELQRVLLVRRGTTVPAWHAWYTLHKVRPPCADTPARAGNLYESMAIRDILHDLIVTARPGDLKTAGAAWHCCLRCWVLGLLHVAMRRTAGSEGMLHVHRVDVHAHGLQHASRQSPV